MRDDQAATEGELGVRSPKAVVTRDRIRTSRLAPVNSGWRMLALALEAAGPDERPAGAR